MVKEQKFYKALQDICIGTRIESNDDFVNLMGIKLNCYRKVKKLLKADIGKAGGNMSLSGTNFMTSSINFLAGVLLKAAHLILIKLHFITMCTKGMLFHFGKRKWSLFIFIVGIDLIGV